MERDTDLTGLDEEELVEDALLVKALTDTELEMDGVSPRIV